MRDIKYDLIRCIAIVFVICIHSMGAMNEALLKEDVTFSLKLIGLCFNSIIYTGVPLFTLLSGSLLLGKTETLKIFFKKRLKRIFIPFLLWSFFVFLIKYMEQFQTIDITHFILTFTNQFFSNGTHGIYWYVYLIIGLYLITPILRVIFVNANKEQIYYFGGILIVFTLASKICPNLTVFYRFSSLNLEYITYFILGYIISHYLIKEIPKGNFVKIAYIGMILSIGGYLIDQFFFFNSNIPWFFFTSIFLFSAILSSECESKSNRIHKAISFISFTSYGIYLSHFLFISLFIKLEISTFLPIYIQPIIITLIVLISNLLFMLLIQKIKLEKYLM